MKNFHWQLDQSSSQSTHLNVQKVQFGDGYEQVVSFGINNARTTWQASVTNTKAVIDEIYRFLNATRGVEVFTIAPVPDEPRIKVRLDGELSRQNLGGDVWQISFNLRQTF